MPRIAYIEMNGTRHDVEVSEGTSVMRGALDNGIPGIDADCGGECACGTCHVYVEGDWFAKTGALSEMEASMLSFADATKPNSRLSCQIKMTKELDGLVVGLPDGQH